MKTLSGWESLNPLDRTLTLSQVSSQQTLVISLSTFQLLRERSVKKFQITGIKSGNLRFEPKNKHKKKEKFCICNIVFHTEYLSTYICFHLCFTPTGSHPKESKKTLIRVHEVEELTTQSWGMKLNTIDEQSVEVIVMSPADAIVGDYSIYVETTTKQEGLDEDLVYRRKLPHKLYILFNAWCKGKKIVNESRAIGCCRIYHNIILYHNCDSKPVIPHYIAG